MDTHKRSFKKYLLIYIAMVLTSTVVLLLCSADNIEYTSAEDYGNFEDFEGHSNLSIFPGELPDRGENVRYLYRQRKAYLTPASLVYLECSYDKDAYNAEIERLKSISMEYEGNVNRIRYDVGLFQYPAFVSIFDEDQSYEYALLLEDRRIAYIFLQHMGMKSSGLDEAFFPLEYGNTQLSYSIYAFSDPAEVLSENDIYAEKKDKIYLY